ncbi:MAG: DNA internalization-related competence protein ComEC/Rec2 [Bacteroidota bacterium]
MRSWTRYAIQRAVPTPGARSLLHALMLGDRSGLDPAVRSAFRMTGLAHLLAISGLHIMLVGLTVYRLGRPLLQRLGLSWRRAEHVAAATAISLLSGYVALAGAPASAVRALLMMTLWIGGSLLQRPTQPLNLLGAAATVLLVADPAVLFDVGAQLSFSAVGGLIVLVGPVQRRLQAWGPSWRGRRYLEGSLVASAVATMATTPVLLHHLGGVPLGGIVLNLVALPLVSAALMAGFVAVATSPWTWLSEVAGRAAAVGLDTLIHLLDTVAPWFERVYVTGGPVPVLVLVVAVLGLVILREHLHPHTRGRCLLLMLVLTNVQLWGTVWSGTEQPALTLLIFDVGQGDAALVQFPNGRHLLVDTGARSPWSDHGRQTIVPHLKRAGIRRLEGVMITHAHRDHMGGLPSVLRHVEVGAVWHNAQVHDSALYGEARHVADSLGVPWIRLKAGDHLRVDPTVLTQILGPSKALTETGSANEASVVLRLRHGQMRALLLGDAEAEAERMLLDHYPALLESEVVKVGHHGSATSSTWPLVRAARSSFATPFLAVVSVAASNHYGLPNQDVLTRWQSSGASVLQTSQVGAVEVRMERSSVRWHGFK